MEEKKGDLLMKFIMRSGQVLGLYADEDTLAELTSHPKFLRFHDKKNNIFMSTEDVMAFEVLNFREPDEVVPEANATQGEEAPQKA